MTYAKENRIAEKAKNFKNHDLTLEEALLILDNIEGLVAVDENGIIKYFAKDLLHLTEFHNLKMDDIKGKHILELHPHSKITNALESGLAIRNYFYVSPFGTNVARISPLYKDGILKGAVDYDIFRDASDLEEFLNSSAKLSSDGYMDLKGKFLSTIDTHKARKNSKYHIGDLVGKSPEMILIRQQISEVCQTDTTVLITGETGSGKELIAHSIHNLSSRYKNRLVEVNCAAIPESLIESELFGYEEGTFTGGKREGKPGLFEISNGGTLFLDEINQLPMHMQAKLLRVLQEKEVMRLGGNKVIPISTRVIAATNKPLKALVSSGDFRQDLYYRLNVFEIESPPLRDRKSDIPLLVNHILINLNPKLNKNVSNIDKESMELLHSYSWPGNVRELYNVVERAMLSSNASTLTLQNFKNYFSEFYTSKSFVPLNLTEDDTLFHKISSYEKHVIENALEKYNWNISKTAKSLGLTRPTLYNKIEKHLIEKML